MSLAMSHSRGVDQRANVLFVALLLGWLAVAGASLVLGAMRIPAETVWQSLLAVPGLSEVSGATRAEWSVLWNLRIPRALLASLVGAILGMGGVAVQAIFRNPLAEPGLIGVSSGAALGAVLSIAFGVASLPGIGGVGSAAAIATCAFVGALVTTGFVVSLASRRGRTSVLTMLLIGIAINAGAGAVLGAISYASTDTQLRNITMWTMGSLAAASWPAIALCSIAAAVAAFCFWRDREHLDLLQLGEAEAFHCGVDVDRLKVRIVLICAATIGCAVAFSGLIGFVGLVVPHIVRMSLGGLHRYLIPGSALLGAGLMVSADVVARTLVAPAELPIGVVTASIGTPFFLYLVFRAQQRLEGQ